MGKGIEGKEDDRGEIGRRVGNAGEAGGEEE